MVAQSLLEAILAEAEKQHARPLRAKMSCGAMNQKCEGMELAVEQKPIKGNCNVCKEVFEFEIRNPVCSNCGKDDFNLLPDEPMMLEEIEFETENEDV
jgi:Zn finger protein HypA/HybF involved in hydrogenase expression